MIGKLISKSYYLADLAVTTAKLAANAVTLAKLATDVQERFWQIDGTVVHNGASPNAWTNLDLSAVVGARAALVLLKVRNNGGANRGHMFRPDGDGEFEPSSALNYGASGGHAKASGGAIMVFCYTSGAGIVEHISTAVDASTITLIAWKLFN